MSSPKLSGYYKTFKKAAQTGFNAGKKVVKFAGDVSSNIDKFLHQIQNVPVVGKVAQMVLDNEIYEDLKLTGGMVLDTANLTLDLLEKGGKIGAKVLDPIFDPKSKRVPNVPASNLNELSAPSVLIKPQNVK